MTGVSFADTMVSLPSLSELHQRYAAAVFGASTYFGTDYGIVVNPLTTTSIGTVAVAHSRMTKARGIVCCHRMLASTSIRLGARCYQLYARA